MARDVLLDRRQFLGLVSGAGAAYAWAAPSDQGAFLYVACPGIRNYLEFGGAGILVFDIRANHAFVRRIVTPASRQPRPENVKGICANATTGRLYFTTLSRLYCLDLRTDETLWEKALPDGCDRLAIHPSGKTLYVPTLEKDHWNIVDALTGDLTARVETKNGAHNTICGPDGKRVYMAGLKAPYLFVLDTESLQVVHKVGPFSAPVRPFTINGRQTRCYVCVNELLGFEVGDLVTGRFLSRVEVKGFARGPVKRHGCPSHGIGMTPDERQIWLCDAANQALHVFEVAGDRFRQINHIRLREQPGWVTFSLDGRYAYASTGEVIDVRTHKVLAGLTDEAARQVHSEKMVEIRTKDGKPYQVGDQFGIGRLTD